MIRTSDGLAQPAGGSGGGEDGGLQPPRWNHDTAVATLLRRGPIEHRSAALWSRGRRRPEARSRRWPGPGGSQSWRRASRELARAACRRRAPDGAGRRRAMAAHSKHGHTNAAAAVEADAGDGLGGSSTFLGRWAQARIKEEREDGLLWAVPDNGWAYMGCSGPGRERAGLLSWQWAGLLLNRSVSAAPPTNQTNSNAPRKCHRSPALPPNPLHPNHSSIHQPLPL